MIIDDSRPSIPKEVEDTYPVCPDNLLLCPLCKGLLVMRKDISRGEVFFQCHNCDHIPWRPNKITTPSTEMDETIEDLKHKNRSGL